MYVETCLVLKYVKLLENPSCSVASIPSDLHDLVGLDGTDESVDDLKDVA